MRQLSLFDAPGRMRASSIAVDSDSAQLITAFEARRHLQGASPRTVAREASQLRSLSRECSGPHGMLPLTHIFGDMRLVARALSEPSSPVSQATVRSRLIAAQRFIQFLAPSLNRDPAADLAALDALLPARRPSGWHTTGTLVAGARNRQRERGPTLGVQELHQIVEAAGAGRACDRSVRNVALVAVQCFSGLRAEEAVALRWEDVSTDLASAGYFGLTASVIRSGQCHRLPLPGPAADGLGALRTLFEERNIPATGHVFRAGGCSGPPLTYRRAREVLIHACRWAGLPLVATADLRAACAHWLRSCGLSDHEVAAVLGIRRVRTVDRLLSRHAALDAQRQVREHVG